MARTPKSAYLNLLVSYMMLADHFWSLAKSGQTGRIRDAELLRVRLRASKVVCLAVDAGAANSIASGAAFGGLSERTPRGIL